MSMSNALPQPAKGYNGKKHHYTEKVQCLDLDKFKDFALMANLKVQNVFGDYSLNPFDENKSDRLILILQ